MYDIKLENFEGPFDVLLKMLGEKKLDIKDVSLVAITDQFIDFIHAKNQIDIKNLANFLSIAAHLFLLKSKAVLPSLELSEEEEEDVESLKKKLERYKKLQDLTSKLRNFIANQGRMFSRGMGKINYSTIGFYPPQNLTAQDLKKIFAEVVENYEKISAFQALPEESIQEIISLEEKIKDLKKLISSGGKNSFSSITRRNSSIEVVISFLAVLELVKQDLICVYQEENFGEIEITNK